MRVPRPRQVSEQGTVSRSRIGGFWRLSQQEGSDLLDRLGEVQSFAGSVVELAGYPVKVHRAVDREVGALGEVLAQEAVGVLAGAALPRCVRVTEVDVDVGGDAHLFPVAHLWALVPGQ